MGKLRYRLKYFILRSKSRTGFLSMLLWYSFLV